MVSSRFALDSTGICVKLLPICTQYPNVLIEAAWDIVSSRFAFDLIGIFVKLLTCYS